MIDAEITKRAPVVQKAYDHLFWTQNHVNHFPKSERFRLAKRMEDNAYKLMDTLLQAWMFPNQRSESLQKADFLVQQGLLYFRLSSNKKLTTVSSYEFAAKNLTEIGKMIGGWIKQGKKELEDTI
jgi:hypothetical protein